MNSVRMIGYPAAYFITFNSVRIIGFSHLRGAMRNSQSMTFNSFILFPGHVYYMTKHELNIEFVIMLLFIITCSF